MNTSRIRTATVGVVASALIAVGGTTATASTQDWQDCSDGNLCLWAGYQWSGDRQDRTQYDDNLGDVGFDQKASSLGNNTGVYWYAFTQDFCRGEALEIPPEVGLDLSDTDWDDAIQSIAREDELDTCQNR